MQIDKRYRIEEAASKDFEKIPLNYIQIDNSSAVASDGVIAAVVPCASGKGEVKGPITRDSLVYARTHTLGDGAIALHLQDDLTVVAEDTTVFPRSLSSYTAKEEGEQLELIQVEKGHDGTMKCPNVKDMKKVIPVIDDHFAMKINPEALFRLAKALGDKEELILFIRADDDDIVRSPIRAHGFDGAVGVILPMVVDEKKDNIR